MAANDDGLVLFSGYAKLPVGITASEMYKVIGVILVVRVETGEIMEADCTLATSVARNYVSNILLGHSLKNGPESVLRIIYDKYRSFMEEQNTLDIDHV